MLNFKLRVEFSDENIVLPFQDKEWVFKEIPRHVGPKTGRCEWRQWLKFPNLEFPNDTWEPPKSLIPPSPMLQDVKKLIQIWHKNIRCQQKWSPLIPLLTALNLLRKNLKLEL